MEKKKLNLFDLVSMGIGSTIGSGIFAMVGIGIAMTGRSVNLALVTAVIMALFMFIPTILLSGVTELEGGIVTQAKVLLGRKWGSLQGYVFIAINLAIAIYSITMVDYLVELMGGLAPYHKLISVIIVLLFFVISIRGTKFMAKIQGVIVVTMLLSLGMFIIFGISKVEPNYYEGPGFMTGGVEGFILAACILSFASQGTNSIVNYSSDAKNSKRDIPLAMIITLMLVGVVYFGIGTVAAGVLPLDQVAGRNLGGVARTILPYPMFIIFIFGGACFALGSSLNNTLAGLKYPTMQVARDGYLPKILLKTDKKYEYPYVIMGLFLIVGIAPILLNVSLEVLVSLVQIPTFLLAMLMSFATIRLPKIYGEAWESSTYYVKKPVLYFLSILGGILCIVQIVFLLTMLTTPVKFGSLIVMLIGIGYVNYRDKQINKDNEPERRYDEI